MSDRKNLYKMDDIFIFLSYFMIVPIVFMLLPWLMQLQELLNEGAETALNAAWPILGTRLFMAGGYLLAGLLMQIIGRSVRKKENHCLDILDILQYSRKTTVSVIANQLELSEGKTHTLISGLSAMPSLGVSLDGNDVELVDPSQRPFQKPAAPPRAESKETEMPESVREAIKAQGADPDRGPAFSTTETHSEWTVEQTDGDGNTTTRTGTGAPPKDLKDLFNDFKEMKKSGKGPATLKEFIKEIDFNGPEKTGDLNNMNPDELEEEANRLKERFSQATGEKAKLPFNIVFFAIMMMTPLWPVALIYAGTKIYKQAKGKNGDDSAAPGL